MNSKNIAGAVAKAIANVRTPALKNIADRSTESFKRNCGFLTKMPAVKQKSYLDHLNFLNSGADNHRITDIANISNQNLVNFIDIVAKVPVASGWRECEEFELLKRVNDLQFVFNHGSMSPELILDSGSIYSRSVISGETSAVPGLMKKPGDERYRYNDFVFFRLGAVPSGHEVTNEPRHFKFLFDEKLLQESCMFLRDCFSNRSKRIIDEESLYLGNPYKDTFCGTSCYIETDNGKFRWRVFDEDREEVCVTDFIANEQQFFFGEDIKSAIFLSTALYSRIFGPEYLLNLSDEDFAKDVTKVAGFEMRVPNRISLDKSIQGYQKPSQKMTAKERIAVLQKARDNLKMYNGTIYD